MTHSLKNRNIFLNTIAAVASFFIAGRSSGLVTFFTVPRVAAGSFGYGRGAAGFQPRWTSMHHSDHEFYKFKQL
jgi:hypothetical protein